MIGKESLVNTRENEGGGSDECARVHLDLLLSLTLVLASELAVPSRVPALQLKKERVGVFSVG